LQVGLVVDMGSGSGGSGRGGIGIGAKYYGLLSRTLFVGFPSVPLTAEQMALRSAL
jgi:hypothetical protein